MSADPSFAAELFMALLGLPCLALACTWIPRLSNRIVWCIGITSTSAIALLSLLVTLNFDGTSAIVHGSVAPYDSAGLSTWLSLNGTSLTMLLFTTLLMPCALITGHRPTQQEPQNNTRYVVRSTLSIETTAIIVFCAQDLSLWLIAFITLLLLTTFTPADRDTPLQHREGLFQRAWATGSIALVGAGLLYIILCIDGGSQNADSLRERISDSEQYGLFACFTLGFGLLTPLFPFQGRLTRAQARLCPNPITLLGCAVGVYGLMRFSLGLCPIAWGQFSPLLLVLAVLGIAYNSMSAWSQPNLKRAIPFAIGAQLNLVVLGLVALQVQSLQGALLHMLHLALSLVMFQQLFTLLDRRGAQGGSTPTFADNEAKPWLYGLMFVATLHLICAPGTGGFVSEFLLVAGLFDEGYPAYPGLPMLGWPNLVMAASVAALLGMLLSALAMLRHANTLMRPPIAGAPNHNARAALTLRERLSVLPAIALSLSLGLVPNTVLDATRSSVTAFVTQNQTAVAHKWGLDLVTVVDALVVQMAVCR